MIAGEAHEHGTHAKVDPASGNECAHAGIDHGVASVTCCPCLVVRFVVFRLAEAIIGVVEIFEFDPWFVFELLHEMTMPPQASG